MNLRTPRHNPNGRSTLELDEQLQSLEQNFPSVSAALLQPLTNFVGMRTVVKRGEVSEGEHGSSQERRAPFRVAVVGYRSWQNGNIASWTPHRPARSRPSDYLKVLALP